MGESDPSHLDRFFSRASPARKEAGWPRSRHSRGRILRRDDSGMERGRQFQEKASGVRGLWGPPGGDPELPDYRPIVTPSHSQPWSREGTVLPIFQVFFFFLLKIKRLNQVLGEGACAGLPPGPLCAQLQHYRPRLGEKLGSSGQPPTSAGRGTRFSFNFGCWGLRRGSEVCSQGRPAGLQGVRDSLSESG